MDRLRLCSHLPEILGRKTNYSGSGRPLNGPPTTLLRVCWLSFVLKLAAMYVCEPEYDINLFVCMHRNKNACQTVTVRFLNKQTNKQTICLRISMQLYKGFGPFFRSTAAVTKRRQWDVCNIWQLFMVQSSLHTYLVKCEFDCEVSHHDFYVLYFHRYIGQLLLVQLRGFFKT